MYNKSTLPNGLKVITHSMKDRESVSLGILIKTGGRYEEDRIKGAAHFLEHIVFKGTKQYSCEDIKEQVEGVGGSLNAFTSEEVTCYFAKIPAKHLNKTFDILADMVCEPLILKSDVKKEGGVIVEEIKMYHDLPQYFVLELLEGLMWPNHPLGKKLSGTTESVSRMTNTDLRKFHKQHYWPGNIVVASCGSLKHEQLVKLVKAKFGKFPNKRAQRYEKADNSQSKPKVKFYRKNIEQMHLALGMLGLEYNHKDRYKLSLLNIILGGNMSSRLFDEVREKRGLAYSISSGAKSLNDTGVLLIRAGVDNKKIIEAVNVILRELNKLKNNGVTKGEFTRAREFYLGQVLIGLEDTLDHMLWLGEDVIYSNKPRTLKEVVKEINKITVKDMKLIAEAILNENRYNLALVGPLNDTQEKELKSLIGV